VELIRSNHKARPPVETLTPVTVYRVPPFESVLYGLRAACAWGAALANFCVRHSKNRERHSILHVT